MKKRKRERLNKIKEEKRLEWEKVKTILENELPEDCHVVELDVDGMMDLHFMNEQYGCENCQDYLSEVCGGESYTTYDECYNCMRSKFESGDRVMAYTNIGHELC